MEQRHHRISTVNLVGGASTTVNMTVSEEGRWLISSLVQKHLKGKETSIYEATLEFSFSSLSPQKLLSCSE